MSITVWYLYHSGFAVETPDHFLIFDHWKNTSAGAGLSEGVVDPAALTGKNVIVFASHAHGDHYNPEILSWRQQLPDIRIVLSDDIRPAPAALMIGPDQTLEQPDFTLHTLRSTDEGVAFLLQIDSLCIYHAGDLNWWHWAGETDQYNKEMAANYKLEIDKLAGMAIDLAFVPVDLRLEDQYAWGIDYLMHTAQVRHVVPMHFGTDAAVVDRLLNDPVSMEYRDRVVPLTRRGQSAKLQ